MTVSANDSDPATWQATTLGAIHRDEAKGVVPNRTPKATFELYSVPSHESGLPDFVRGGEIGSSKQTVIPKTVLLCKINPRINRVWIVGDKGHHEQIASTEWIPFFPTDNVLPSYLAWYLRQKAVRDFLASNASGVGGSLMRVKASTLRDFPFRFPLLDEQQRIVAEIEKQFTRLEAGVGSLKRVQTALKRYRASVLKAACEGRLVPTEADLARRESRSYESASTLLARILQERAGTANRKLKSPVVPEARRLPLLPEGWTSATLDQLSHLITKGSSPNWQGFEYCNTGIVFVRSENVRWGSLNLAGAAHLPPAFNEKEKKSVLHEGDVLLNLVGASIGRAALASVAAHGGNTNQAVAVIRTVLKEPLNKFAVLWLISAEAQKLIHAEKVDVARANFSLEDARALPFPLPPLAEQHRIVAEVERRLSVVEELEAVVAANFRRATRLRQSILRKAFTGKL